MRLAIRRRWAPHTPLAVIVALYLATAAAYAWRVPILEGADEHGHALVVEHVAANGSPPRIGTLWEAVQPPLYYAVAAVVHGASGGGKIVPATLRLNEGFRFDDPRSADAFDPRSYSPVEANPARRLRVLSILFGALTLVCIYATALAITRGRRLPALAAAALPALTPMYAQHHAVITNDSLATLWCAVVVWQLARYVMTGATTAGGDGARRTVGMGIAAGLGIWTKLTMAPVAAAAVVALLAWGPGPAAARRRAAVRFALTAFAVAGPWLILNTWHYGDPLARAAMQEAHGALAVRRTPLDLMGDGWFMRRVFESYWGRLGSLTVPLRTEAYAGFDLLAAIGALGLPVAVWRRAIDRRVAAALGLVAGLTWAAFVAHNLRLTAPQGRLLFPALPAISVLWAAGWTAVLDAAVAAAGRFTPFAAAGDPKRARGPAAAGASATAGLVAALVLVNLQTLAGPVQFAYHDVPAARVRPPAASAPRAPAVPPGDGARPVASRAIRAVARPDRPRPASPPMAAVERSPVAVGAAHKEHVAKDVSAVATVAVAEGTERRDERDRRRAPKPRPPFDPGSGDEAAEAASAVDVRRLAPNIGEAPPLGAEPWVSSTPLPGGVSQPVPVPPAPPPPSA